MYTTRAQESTPQPGRKSARIFRLSFILIIAFGVGLIAHAAPRDESAEQLALLYSSRLTFTADGVPEASVGLMSDQTNIQIDCSTGCRVIRYTPAQHTGIVSHAEPLRVKILRSTPGRTLYHVVIETLPRSRRSELPELMADWAQRGTPVSSRQIGSVVALNGQILDNLRYLVIAGSYENDSQAQSLATQLRAKYKSTVYVFPEIDQMPSAELALMDANGSTLFSSHNLIEFQSTDKQPLRVPNCEYDQGFPGAGRADLLFDRTLLAVVDRNGKLALANRLPLEDVLKGTVPAEMFSTAPAEALKAQAIAARGQLIGELGARHLADPFHLCASQHCQVYRGHTSRRDSTDAAVDATRGKFLVADGKLVETSYSACAGGYTASNDTAWPQLPDPHRRARFDGSGDTRFETGISESNLSAFLDQPPQMYCTLAGVNQQYVRWSRDYTPAQMDSMVSARYPIGSLVDLVPQKRGPSGRLIELELIGQKGRATIARELPIRRLFGNLPSALIRITIQRDATGNPTRFHIDGAGFGHGVGMCQTGAIGRAKAGQSAEEILRFYYNGADIKTLY
jgi:SpoIID/LytB domain protein